MGNSSPLPWPAPFHFPFCCLRPGIAGYTENIRVRSVIGRFLEHSRIFHFANGSADPLEGEYVIGSADWMFRNLWRRVEAAVPVRTAQLRERLWEILEAGLADRRQAWEMPGDGRYVQCRPDPQSSQPAGIGTHDWLMRRTRARQSVRLAT